MTEVKKAVEAFSQALFNLLVLVAGMGGEKKLVAAAPETAAKEWPKNFSVFRKAWMSTSPKAQGAVGAIFELTSCAAWSPAKVDFILMGGDADFEVNATQKDSVGAVRAVLAEELGFAGELVIRRNTAVATTPPAVTETPAAAEKRTRRTKAEMQAAAAQTSAPSTAGAITADQLKKACCELAKKPEVGKQGVLDILAKFGATKVDAIDPAKYPAILEAVTNYGETTTSTEDEGF